MLDAVLDVVLCAVCWAPCWAHPRRRPYSGEVRTDGAPCWAHPQPARPPKLRRTPAPDPAAALSRPDGGREPAREPGAELGAVEPSRELGRDPGGDTVRSLVATWSLEPARDPGWDTGAPGEGVTTDAREGRGQLPRRPNCRCS